MQDDANRYIKAIGTISIGSKPARDFEQVNMFDTIKTSSKIGINNYQLYIIDKLNKLLIILCLNFNNRELKLLKFASGFFVTRTF